jgi:hypothetical protein
MRRLLKAQEAGLDLGDVTNAGQLVGPRGYSSSSTSALRRKSAASHCREMCSR